MQTHEQKHQKQNHKKKSTVYNRATQSLNHFQIRHYSYNASTTPNSTETQNPQFPKHPSNSTHQKLQSQIRKQSEATEHESELTISESSNSRNPNWSFAQLKLTKHTQWEKKETETNAMEKGRQRE